MAHDHDHSAEVDLRVLRVHLRPGRGRSRRGHSRRHLWHPFTQQQGWMEEDFPIIESADDTTLYDTEGNAYIDGVSSLWLSLIHI